MIRIEIAKQPGRYPAGSVGCFVSDFIGDVHVYITGGDHGCIDLTPDEARHYAAGLIATALEAEDAVHR